MRAFGACPKEWGHDDESASGGRRGRCAARPPLVAQAAQGLDGSYYQFAQGPGNVANTLTAIGTFSAPTATFTANEVCFPSCNDAIGDDAALSAFLGGNATGLSNDVTGVSNHGLVLSGFLNIATTGSHLFTLNSDDGSQLFIDGALVVDDDGEHGLNAVSNSVSLTAGSHAIRIIQFEDGGVTGLTLFEDGAAVSGAQISTGGLVPEPASWALMLVGFGGLGAVLRARRRDLAAV